MANAARRMLGALVDRIRSSTGVGDSPGAQEKMNGRIARLGLTPRQLALNSLWAWYRNQRYDACGADWNGDKITDTVETEMISTQGFVPNGFVAAGADFPLKFRKPTAPYALPRVIVNRFTGILFGKGHAPKICVAGDPATEDWINAAFEAAGIWAQMNIARPYGGAMGTVAIGFQFVNGLPVIEVHDPRWCEPKFVAHGNLELQSFEKRYIYPEDERNPETQKVEAKWYWYRRVIDQESDTLWDPVPVGEGDEPVWDDLPNKRVEHDFGFVPVVWIQNKPVQDSHDGDPDCEGIFDNVETIDRLISQANKGTIANADPTPVVTTDAELKSLKTGSDGVLKLPQGGTFAYAEMTGGGTKMAIDLFKELRSLALEVAQCVLDHPEAGGQKTATEIERVYASMLECAGVLQVQYGDTGLKPLAEKMIKAAKILGAGRPGEDGEVHIGAINLPPRVTTRDDGTVETQPRALGQGGTVSCKWPPFFTPTLDEIAKAIDAMGKALQSSLIDEDTAVAFVAKMMGIEDTVALRAKIKAEKAKREQEQAAQMAAAMGGGFR